MGKKSKVEVRGIVEKAKNRHEPILVNFEHATVKRSADTSDNFSASIYKTELQSQRAPKTLVSIQHEDRLLYLGSNDSHLSSSNEMRTFIAIKNRSDKSIKLYETTQVTVSPFIPGKSYIEEVEKDTTVKLSRDERRRKTGELIMAFGSKAKVLKHESLLKVNVAPEEMDKSLHEAAEKADVDNLPAQVNPEDSVNALIPPCNRISRSPQEVYRLADLITPDELDELQELAEQFLALSNEEIANWRISKKFSEYFLTMWEALSMKKADKEIIYKTKLVIYTELLISILKLKAAGLKLRPPPISSEFPDWLIQKALNIFTFVNASNTRTYSVQLQDKTICHILILMLLTNNYILDVPMCLQSLQIHVNKLTQLARIVGVTLKYESATREYKAGLSIPLPSLEIRGFKRRK